MGRNNYFQFKQFRIIQEKSAMKVGTDGVLLGAWANVGKANRILDVGTGTGVIALMMAQRSQAKITAIEIEKQSFEEAGFNFGQSPWNNRISSFFGSFQDYVSMSDLKFDLVISNPPFFENASKAADPNRSNARHTDLLPYSELLAGSKKLLSDSGRVAVIIPESQAQKFIALAEKQNLFVARLTKVKPRLDRRPHRFLLEFVQTKSKPEISELAIETNSYLSFTSEYIKLTKDFYLLF